MVPSLRGQPTAPVCCALPGERWLPGLRAERRAKDTTSALLLVVATDTKPATVKLTQEIEESCVDAVVYGMMPSSWTSALVKLTQEVEESRVDVVVTARCSFSPGRQLWLSSLRRLKSRASMSWLRHGAPPLRCKLSSSSKAEG